MHQVSSKSSFTTSDFLFKTQFHPFLGANGQMPFSAPAKQGFILFPSMQWRDQSMSSYLDDKIFHSALPVLGKSRNCSFTFELNRSSKSFGKVFNDNWQLRIIPPQKMAANNQVLVLVS